MKTKQPPTKIYLQWYDEDGEPLDALSDEVTWCVDEINPTDVEYRRADPNIAAISRAEVDRKLALRSERILLEAIDKARTALYTHRLEPGLADGILKDAVQKVLITDED